MASNDEVLKQTVRINYMGESRDILYWYVKLLLLTIITLGFYGPVAANRLLRYLTSKTVLCIYDVVESEEE